MGYKFKKYPLVSVLPDSESYLTYQTYLASANLIPGWRKIGKNELANLYLDNIGDEEKRSSYFSALMLSYWGVVNMYVRTSKSLRVDGNDCSMWLAESILRAMKYHRWRDKGNKLYGNPDAPDIVIRQCIWTTRQKYYHDANRSNRKTDYLTYSLDTGNQFQEDEGTDSRFSYEDTHYLDTESDMTYRKISQYYADMDLTAHSVVSDALFSGKFLAYGTASKGRKKKVSINLSKLARYFSDTDMDYLREYYRNRLDIDSDQLDILLTNYRTMKPKSLRNHLSGVVKDIRSSSKVREMLCW